jgi:hypothetical protein
MLFRQIWTSSTVISLVKTEIKPEVNLYFKIVLITIDVKRPEKAEKAPIILLICKEIFLATEKPLPFEAGIYSFRFKCEEKPLNSLHRHIHDF